MSEDARLRTRIIGKLALTIVVAGVLLAGLLLPWVGGGGLVARNSASLLDALPVELTDATPVGMSKVVAADGTLITNLYEKNRTPVTSDQIADVMKQALVDIEDSRFYEHNGLDVQGTMRALVRNLAAGSVQEGGSTLTQQLVKQTLLQTADSAEGRDAATEQTPARKLREARLALALEETYDKDEILTRYLNIVYFGKGAYGIQAAAQRYFSVDAADLTLPQAAMLAGLVQSPFYDDPIDNPEKAQVRRNQVLARMLDLEHITEQEYRDIAPTPVAITPGLAPPNGCIDASIGAFFCDYALKHLTQDLGLTDDQLKNGALTIKTTLLPDLQRSGDQAVLQSVPMGDRLAGMFTAIEPGTGRVLAMSVNRRYGCEGPECEEVVLNTAASKGAGSTYKTFTAAAALEAGIPANTTITTPGNRYTSRVFRGPACGAEDRNGTNESGPYCVRNAGNYPATLDMVGALVRSSNTYFLALEDRLRTVEGPVRMAERMGMTFGRPGQQKTADEIIDGNFGSFTFGAEATSPLDLANAYATLGAEGTKCTPVPVTEVLDRNGEPLTQDNGEPVVRGDNCTPESIPANIANTLSTILVGDVATPAGTGTRAAIPGRTIAGKTGTSQGRDSVAFVGYLPEYSASVMVFNPKEKQDVGGFGGNLPATIWRNAMAPFLEGKATTAFPPADPKLMGPPKPAPRPQSPRPPRDTDDADERPADETPAEDGPTEEEPAGEQPTEEQPAPEAPQEGTPAPAPGGGAPGGGGPGGGGG
ncbi:Membrane carboxypeptidase (penicillin-binding protein) [Blastococcus aurantiacus]|uniref:Membrane carboxypeptidase (Penicillin-binding protein) n=1 Tax=Blastococcus aurantiacus TaxID=1550231 RepID=A0A1G7MLE3_9ACTN|nr:transglycosylase domain-containing protein [Blastococcus aurantiacus]SDF62436.1 Membrane carboxypeptidase (penicillin-binding protein) [Blastococcus aurantiacus]